jgi:hypothetical protein
MKVRFSISNLLLLTALVGVLVAWYLDHRQLSQRYQANTDSLTWIASRVKSLQNEVLPFLKNRSEKYHHDGSEDINYYRNKSDDLQSAVEQARELLSKIFYGVADIEVR